MLDPKTLRTLGFLAVALTVAATVRAQPSAPPAPDLRLQLRAMVFDPAEPLPEISPSLLLSAAAEAATERRIIQFEGPLTREERAMLTEEHGLRLTDYIPNHAYLERIRSDAVPRLERLDSVRAIVTYQPAFKMSAEMGERIFRTEARRSMDLLVRAVLFDDADPAAVALVLERIRGIESIEVREFPESGAPARIQFTSASRELLPEVAQIDDVRWIEEVAEQDEDGPRDPGQTGVAHCTPS